MPKNKKTPETPTKRNALTRILCIIGLVITFILLGYAILIRAAAREAYQDMSNTAYQSMSNTDVSYSDPAYLYVAHDASMRVFARYRVRDPRDTSVIEAFVVERGVGIPRKININGVYFPYTPGEWLIVQIGDIGIIPANNQVLIYATNHQNEHSRALTLIIPPHVPEAVPIPPMIPPQDIWPPVQAAPPTAQPTEPTEQIEAPTPPTPSPTPAPIVPRPAQPALAHEPEPEDSQLVLAPFLLAQLDENILAIMADMGTYPIYAVVINGRRIREPRHTFIVDVWNFLAPGENLISIFAEDIHGNRSTPMFFTVAEANPFTPEGQATVVDIATTEDQKEFFTFATPAGNIFHLIVDHQREGNNVYFLSAVNEADLIALAQYHEQIIPTSQGHVIPPTHADPPAQAGQWELPPLPVIIQPTPQPTPDMETEQDSEAESTNDVQAGASLPYDPASNPYEHTLYINDQLTESNSDNSDPTSEQRQGSGINIGQLLVVLLVSAVAVCVLYYFRILRPRKQRQAMGEDEEDFDDYDIVDEDYEADEEGEISEHDTSNEDSEGEESDLQDEYTESLEDTESLSSDDFSDDMDDDTEEYFDEEEEDVIA